MARMSKQERLAKEEEAGLIEEALKRFDRAVEAERDQRELSLEDIKFAWDEDSQWTEDAKSAREGRPRMTFNRVAGAIDQVYGDHVQNQPGIKVRPTKDGTVELADVYAGLIRYIESQSNAKRAHKTAFKLTAGGGLGFWRIVSGYVDDDAFDQDLMIEEIANPFVVYGDPMAKKPSKEDGKFWFVCEDMLREDFEEQYPNAAPNFTDFNATGFDQVWFSDDMVKVAEYYRKVPEEKTIYLLSNGIVMDNPDILDELAEAGITVVRERQAESYRIEHYLITGAEILETYEYPGRFFPIVPMYGKMVNIEGKIHYRGLVRFAKDAQRSYNYERSNYIEQNALQPKQPYLATEAMIEGHERAWENLNTSNDPVLLFNFDQGQGPSRQAPGQPPSSYAQAVGLSADDIKATTGIYDASMGARSNETSGRAILERDKQGDTATYEYTDEFAEALEYEAKVLIDLIPRYYDSERVIQITGEDGSETDVEINKVVLDDETGQEMILNDLSFGQYGAVVTTGASYATKRTETAEQLSQVMAQNPQLGQLLGDVYIKSLDLIEGEEVVARIRRMLLQQNLIEPNDEEKEEAKQRAQQNPEEQQQKQMQEQMRMRAMMADVEMKEAEVKLTQAKASDSQAAAALKAIQAQVEQLQLAMNQGDLAGQRMILQRLVGSIGSAVAAQPPMQGPMPPGPPMAPPMAPQGPPGGLY